MKTRSVFHRRLVVILFSCSFFIMPRPAGADWPLYRRDAQASASIPNDPTPPGKLTRLWEHRLEKGWFQATPIVVGSVVYLGSGDDGMMAFHLADGSLTWKYPLPLGVLAPASYFKSRDGTESIFFGDTDGILYALDARTGKERWKFQTKGSIDNAPNVDEWSERVLVGSQDGTLYALDSKTGESSWEFKTGDQIRCFPTIAGRRCFVAGCDSKLHVVDLDKGKSVAEVELDAPTGSTPTVQGDHVFFGTEGNEFLAVDWKNAKIAWRFEMKHAVRGPAACKDGLVVFCGMDRSVHALDAATGTERWSFRTKGRMEYSGPVLAGNRVYVAGSDSFLYVLDLKSGEKKDAVECSGKLLGSPAVDNGRILLGTDDGTLICLGKED